MRSQITLVLLALTLGLAQSAADDFVGTWALKSKPDTDCGIKGDKIYISQKSDQLLLEITFANDLGCLFLAGQKLELFSEIPPGKTASFKGSLSEEISINMSFTVDGEKGFMGGDGMTAEFERSKGGSFLIIIIIILLVIVGGGAAFFIMKKKDKAQGTNNYLHA